MPQARSLRMNGLRSLAYEIADTLFGTSFELPPIKSEMTHDPRCCLRGSPLRLAEVQAGYAVKRRIFVESLKQDIDFDNIIPWLKREKGKTLLFFGEAGEGKTTFINYICNEFWSEYVILFWDINKDGIFDYENLIKFHDNLCKLSSKKIDILVLGELESGIDSLDAFRISNSLAERAKLQDSSTIILFGRPSELQIINYRLPNTETLRLMPLDTAEAKSLCHNLKKAYLELIRAGYDNNMITLNYPNLLNLLDLSENQQVEIFTEPGKPLLAALLEAVYGEDFWKRLKNEFDALENNEKMAYMQICIASLAGVEIPENLLLRLIPGAKLDQHCNYNPWIRTTKNKHRARHRTIAQTVIEESNMHTLLRECIGDWIIKYDNSSGMLRKVSRIYYQLSTWYPIAVRRETSIKFKRKIRNILRNVINENYEQILLMGTCKSENDVYLSMEMAYTINSLIPDELNERHLKLLKLNKEILNSVLAISTNNDLQERIQYYLEKNQINKNKINGKEESTSELSIRVQKWKEFIERDWCGPDFYGDLLRSSAELAERLTFGAHEAEKDSPQMLDVYSTAVKAFEKLRLQTGYNDKCRQLDIGIYSKLIARYIYWALPEGKQKVLRLAWEISVDGGNPNPKTGIQYAKLLETDDALIILETIVDRVPEWGEAYYEMAKIANDETKKGHVIECVKKGLELKPVGLSFAYINHAAALLNEDRVLRANYLEKAIKGYFEYIKSINSPEEKESRGRQMKEVCEELKKMGIELPDECLSRID